MGSYGSANWDSFSKDNEQFWNAIKTFELLYPNYLPKGKNIGIITPGGGASVNLTDLFANQNFKVPILTLESQSKIADILPDVNVNIRNPVDLGASGFILDIFTKCIKVVAKDPKIDIIITSLWPDHIYRHAFKRILEIRDLTSKPLALCLPTMADDGILAKRFDSAKKILHKKRALYFLSLRDAAQSMAFICQFSEFLKSHHTICS